MSFAVIGIYVALIAVKVFDQNVYVSLPFAFLVSGIAAFFLYYAIIRTMQNRGSGEKSLIITTVVFDVLMVGVLGMLADFIQNTFNVAARSFTLRDFDIYVYDVPMMLIASVVMLACMAVGFYYLIYHTHYGIKIRAASENGPLARAFGIHVERIFSSTWFLSGGIAGVTGAIMSLWIDGGPDIIFILTPTMLAGSVVGGFTSLYGAMLGGLLIGISEVAGTSALANYLGSWVIPYSPLMPVIAIIITMLVLPNGLAPLISKLWNRMK